MSKKVAPYLKSKAKLNYTNLDNILFFYMNNDFHRLLFDNNITDVEFMPIIKKGGNSLQVYIDYYNLSAILEFREEYYEYCKYISGCSSQELERSIVKASYNDEFDIEMFIKAFIKSLHNDTRLIKATNIGTKPKSKKKIYSVISIVSLCVPVVAIGIMSAYVLLGQSIKLNGWFLLAIILPLISWFFFGVKSNK